jgi:hypothetical protein
MNLYDAVVSYINNGGSIQLLDNVSPLRNTLWLLQNSFANMT